LLPNVAQIQCDLAGDPHSASRAAKAAMQRATWGRTGRIADETGLCQRTVETWGNPSDPQRSPLQVLEIVMATSLQSGAPFAEATAPLAYLESRFLAPSASTSEGIALAISSALRENAEAIARTIELVRDGVTKAELAEIERQCADSITATHRLVREAQAACSRPLRGKNFQK
jgi:hypothetical protein